MFTVRESFALKTGWFSPSVGVQLDPEQTGFIAVENFTSLAEHHELQLDPSKLEMLLALVQSNEHGHVCYQELIELVRRMHFIYMSTEKLTVYHAEKISTFEDDCTN